MKKLLFVLFIFYVSISYAQNRHVGSFIYEVQNFGAVRDSTIDNTAPIQRALDSAHARGGGSVHVPYGVWGTSKLKLYMDVQLYGDGKATIFKARTADTMFTCNQTNFTGFHGGNVGFGKIVSDFMVEGHGLATVGMSFQLMYWFNLSGIIVDSCASVGVLFKGTLTGSVNNVTIKYCPTGIVLDSLYVPAFGSVVAPNLLEFHSCRFYFSTTWGAFLRRSEGAVAFYNCDFENNGTLHNPNTGSFTLAVSGTDASPGVYFENTWWEANKGTNVKIAASVVAYITLRNCIMQANSSASAGIELNAGSGLQRVVLDNCAISNDSLDIYFKGTSIQGYFKTTEILLLGTDPTLITTNQPTLLSLFFHDLSSDGIVNLKSSTIVPAFTLKSGAGTGASVSIGAWSSNMNATITVTTGTTPVASDTLGFMVFGGSWAVTGTSPVFSPANAAAAALTGAAQIWCANGGTFNYPYFFTGSTALSASTVYKWNVIVPGK